MACKDKNICGLDHWRDISEETKNGVCQLHCLYNSGFILNSDVKVVEQSDVWTVDGSNLATLIVENFQFFQPRGFCFKPLAFKLAAEVPFRFFKMTVAISIIVNAMTP